MTKRGSNKNDTKLKTYRTSPPRRSEFDVANLMSYDKIVNS